MWTQTNIPGLFVSTHIWNIQRIDFFFFMISFLDLTVKGYLFHAFVYWSGSWFTPSIHTRNLRSGASKLAVSVLLLRTLAMLKLLFVNCRSVATCEALVKNQYSLLGWEYSETDSDDSQNLADFGKSQPTEALWTCPCSRFLCFYLCAVCVIIINIIVIIFLKTQCNLCLSLF